MALLLSRTHYSLLTAPCSPQALCEEAVRLGLSHLVLHDANGLYGLYPFAQAARRVGLQAVFGAEVVHRGRRLSVLAQDRRGYASMCGLLSGLHGVGPGSSTARPAGAFDLPRACERFADGGQWLLVEQCNGELERGAGCAGQPGHPDRSEPDDDGREELDDDAAVVAADGDVRLPGDEYG